MSLVLARYRWPRKEEPDDARIVSSDSDAEAAIFILAGADHSFGGSHPWQQTELPDFAQQAAQKTAAFFRGKL